MATRSSYLDRPDYFYIGANHSDNSFSPSDSQFEFDESELWTPNELLLTSEPKKPLPTKKSTRKTTAIDRKPIPSSSSLPVNIPDWSKILRVDECSQRRRRELAEDTGDDDDEDGRMPPHEYLARTRMASFSVHEGVGRTLKGRDLSRVRNAIWKQTGFED